MKRHYSTKDIIGKKFNHLLITEIFYKQTVQKYKQRYARAICDCGNIVEAEAKSIVRGHIVSCKCARRKRKYDLVGKKFGRLHVLEYIKPDTTNRTITSKYYYNLLCRCDCGNTFRTNSAAVGRKAVSSCGCLFDDKLEKLVNSRRQQLVGQKFGRLVVLEYAGDIRQKSNWKTVCDCGTIKVIEGNSLLTGNTASCGCLQKEQRLNGIGCGVSNSETMFLDAIKELFQLKDLKTQYHLKNRFYDAYLPSKNMLIEVDCSYWHSTPKQKANDEYKTKLATENGFKLVRFPVDTVKDGMKLIDTQFDLLKAILS